MHEVLEFVKVVGVPAAITFFVLWRLDTRLVELIKEIRTLHTSVSAVIAADTGRLSAVEQRLDVIEKAER